MRDHLEDNACELWECGFRHLYSTTESRLDLIKQLLSQREMTEWNITQCQTVLHLLEDDEQFLFVNPVQGKLIAPNAEVCCLAP